MKLEVPKIGMRTVKTAVAVFLCVLIFLPFSLMATAGEQDSFRHLRSLYACIAAVICMQSSVEQTLYQGVSRVIGTVIGGAVGLAALLVDDLARQPILKAFLMGGGIVLTLWLCNLIKRPAACSIGCVVLCVVMLNFNGTDRYLYTFFRVVETTVGIIVAVTVNRILPDRRQNKGE